MTHLLICSVISHKSIASLRLFSRTKIEIHKTIYLGYSEEQIDVSKCFNAFEKYVNELMSVFHHLL